MENKYFKYYMILLMALICGTHIDAQDLHRKNKDLPCVNKNYNIVAHVAVDSSQRQPIWTEDQVESIINITSKFFDPICMSFSLCEYNVLETDYTLGNIRNVPLTIEDRYTELERNHHRIHKINVFFLDTIAGRFCGDSRYFGIMHQDSATVFLERDCTDTSSEQLAHQLGHIFGLRDTYHPREVEYVDGSNCDEVADKLCDTPADPFGQFYITEEDSIKIVQGELFETDRFNYVNDCEFIYLLTDPNGEFYQPDVGNIMGPYPCKCGFTRSQYLKIVEAYEKVDPKHF